MALFDVTAEAVLKAIEEFDRLGRDEFLAKHGFSPARRYLLRYGGKTYDSKAIAGVAHGYLAGQNPLKASEFSGGLAHAVAMLRNLGFEVISQTGPEN